MTADDPQHSFESRLSRDLESFLDWLDVESPRSPVPTVSEGMTIGDYELEDVIGQGGQGIVFRARCRRLERTVAVKTLRAVVSTPEDRDRILREALLASRIEHPSICRIYDVVEHDGLVSIVMEYVKGHGLREFADDRVSTPEGLDTVLGVFVDVCRALHAAHEIGLVHRDIKPANILVREDGAPVVLDFGLARDVATPLTRTGGISGTLPYLAPESIDRSPTRPDRRSDVYALGVALFETTCGVLPFANHNEGALIRSILESPVREARSHNPLISRDLEVVIRTAMSKDVGSRYRDAAALADDIASVRAGREIAARPVPAVMRGLRWMRREKIKTALILMSLITVASATYYFTTLRHEQIDLATRRSSDQSEHLVRVAFAHFANSESGPALQVFQKALDEPGCSAENSACALAGKSRLLLELNRHEEAWQLVDGSEIDGMDRLRAKILYSWGRHEQAAAELEGARGPSSGVGYFITSLAEWGEDFLTEPLERERGRRMLELTERAISLPGPRNPAYHLMHAEAAFRARDVDRIRRAADALVAGWPTESWSHHWAARALMLDAPDEAEAICMRALAIDAKNRDALICLARIKQTQRDWLAALDTLERAEKAGSETPVSLIMRSSCCLELGRPEEALSLALKAQEAAPRDLEGLLAISRILSAMDRHEDALAYVDRAATASPHCAEPLLRRARIEVSLGRFDDAEAGMMRAHALEPSNYVVESELALFDIMRGHLDEARERLDRIVARHPHYSEGLRIRAFLAQKTQDLAAAHLYYARSLEADPWNSEALHRLGTLHARQHRYSAAEAIYRRAILASRRDPVAPVELSRLLAIQGRFREAREILAAAARSESTRDAATAQLKRLEDFELDSASSPIGSARAMGSRPSIRAIEAYDAAFESGAVYLFIDGMTAVKLALSNELPVEDRARARGLALSWVDRIVAIRRREWKRGELPAGTIRDEIEYWRREPSHAGLWAAPAGEVENRVAAAELDDVMSELLELIEE